jgi:uncharacterized membrane protein
MSVGILEPAHLFFAGLLAGEEFVIRFGVRGPVASLDMQPHILLRQALIRRLRILVPAIFALALLSAAAVLFVDGGSNLSFGFRCAGLLALLAFISIALLGTVPINKAALAWEPAAPPPNWEKLIRRWEQLDSARTFAALAAFALFLAATAPQ